MIAIGVASYSFLLWHEPLVRWLAAHGMTLKGRSGFLVNLLIVSSLRGVLAAPQLSLGRTPDPAAQGSPDAGNGRPGPAAGHQGCSTERHGPSIDRAA
jgi:hypothetical protein